MDLTEKEKLFIRVYADRELGMRKIDIAFKHKVSQPSVYYKHITIKNRIEVDKVFRNKVNELLR